MYTNIELFAGAGGLALGLEKAGFNILGLVEIDKSASATLKKNRSNWNVITQNIAELSTQDLLQYFGLKEKELDLLSGGVPCQAFSYAGKGLGFEDTRGTLFYHYAEFLKQLKPKMFLFENVKGLTTHDKGKTFQTIQAVFKEMGYKVQTQILNAWDYGVAQKRERLIMIGVREDLNITFKYPEPLKDKLVLRDILQNVPHSKGMEYGETKKAIFHIVPEGGNWKDVPEEIAKPYMKATWYSSGGKTSTLRRMAWNEPCLTVMTSPSQKTTERCHPTEDRPFTIRESARIQSFPDDWEFVGSVAAQYKQIGNAVPVELAYHVGVAIKNALTVYTN